jgi:hypothetical protein
MKRAVPYPPASPKESPAPPGGVFAFVGPFRENSSDLAEFFGG